MRFGDRNRVFRFQRRSRHALWLLLVGSILLITGGALFLPQSPESIGKSEAAFPGALPFNAKKLAALQAKGSPVFLYFTADWCVTCKVNEAAAINREETVRLFKDRGIEVMVGDFTRRDPEIARFLAERERSGVPLYLFYSATGEPRELRPQEHQVEGVAARAAATANACGDCGRNSELMGLGAGRC